MNEDNKKLVMFDFDGVLVNTAEFWFNLHKTSNGDITWEQFEEMSHGNFIETQRKLLNNASYAYPEDYEKKYVDALHTVFSVVDVLHDTVLKLADKHILIIVSSASSVIISNFLEKENLAPCFKEVLGYDFHTSKVVKINYLLDKYQISPENSVFITDTLGDVREANECNVKSIGVTWGLHKAHTLKIGNPEIIIDSPIDLLNAVETILK
jgi:phosphoglycolate phosphatase